ncbi:SusC/RagA family TonB-linked outer membrane protein [Chitinophaga qingshengii]|uniref:TonB-dependent receptor n=1 Tax=Chitinophaga qingshengii TaxID=1569794 RepID=A0ABR7TH06_9BACT|nr:TonB-dependent receptor [Chitinophaga qingshengii]MBC9929768.1 TonB-dependent receptor [Chitinophaga qingshengii]
MRGVLLLLALLCSGIAGLQAQNRTITGSVTDAKDGHALPGVTVQVKGTAIGTVTNASGAFTVSVQGQQRVLRFSFVGYEEQEVTLGDKTDVRVVLKQNDKVLDEVLVVAYGTQKKATFTGSAAVVKAEVLAERPVTSFEKALQGNVSGVTVQSVSGQPGGATTIRIRGVGGFGTSTNANANGSPLYVVDGIAVTTGDFTQATATADVLATLDPKDIENVTVLKDASAAALYGSRAANGVVLITTKKGKAGRISVNVTGSNGWAGIAVDRHDFLTGEEYFKYWWDARYRKEIAGGATAADAATKANAGTIAVLQANPFSSTTPYDANGNLTPGTTKYYDTDWRNAVTRTGLTQDYGINVSGGTDKTNYYFSAGYFDQKGVVLASDFKRYNTKLNLETRATDFLKFGVFTTFSSTEQNTPPGSTGSANPIFFADRVAPVYSLYQRDASGNPIADPAGGLAYNYINPVMKDYNPVGLSKSNIYNVKTLRAILSAYAEVNFLQHFTFKSQVGADAVDLRESRYYNPLNGDGKAVNGRSNKYAPRDTRTTIVNTLIFDNRFNKHHVNVLAGQEAFKYVYTNLTAGSTGFPFEGISELGAGSTASNPTSDRTEKKFNSYFSRVNYDFDGKYILSGSLRTDGSSIFGEQKRYGIFWSVGGAWLISRENFMSSTAGWLNELKIKGSHGLSGADNIGRYDRLDLYDAGANYNGQAGTKYTQLGNPVLRWERAITTDVGIEAYFINRIRVEAGYYRRGSDGLLFDKPLSMTTGFESVKTNLAKLNNTGFEASVEANVIRKNDFTLDLGANFTSNRNKIVYLTGIDSMIAPTGSKLWKVGGNRYQFFLPDYAGVDPVDGRPMWYMNETDNNGNLTGKRTTTKQYTQASRYQMGSSLPKFYGGFNLKATYKGFDLSAMLFFNYGNKIYDSYLQALSNDGANPGTNIARDVAARAWQKPNDMTDVPRFMQGNTDLGSSTSSRFLFDGSYMRLKTVNLGYSLPKSLLYSAHIQRARIYVAAENLFTWAKHKGMDPEVEVDGFYGNDIPNVKTFTVGVNIGF